LLLHQRRKFSGNALRVTAAGLALAVAALAIAVPALLVPALVEILLETWTAAMRLLLTLLARCARCMNEREGDVEVRVRGAACESEEYDATDDARFSFRFAHTCAASKFVLNGPDQRRCLRKALKRKPRPCAFVLNLRRRARRFWIQLLAATDCKQSSETRNTNCLNSSQRSGAARNVKLKYHVWSNCFDAARNGGSQGWQDPAVVARANRRVWEVSEWYETNNMAMMNIVTRLSHGFLNEQLLTSMNIF
jgi:hypothetical protein